MKISTKFIALFIVTVVTAIAATTTYCLVQFHDQEMRQAAAEQESRLKTFRELLQRKGTGFSVADGNLAVGSYVISGNNELPDKMKELFGGGAAVYLGDVQVATSLVNNDGSRALGAKMEAPAYDAVKQGRSYRSPVSIDGLPYFITFEPIKNSRGEVIGALSVGTRESDFLADMQKTKMKVVVLAAVLVVLFSAIAVFLIRRSLRPLDQLKEAARRAADGSLEEVTGVTGSDEIASLAEAFNNMTTVLVKNMRGEIDKGNRLFASIREAVAQLSSTTSHVTIISTQQSSCASQQASAVQEVTVTAAEIAATAKEITRNAQRVEHLAEDTASACIVGSGAVNNASAGMAELKTQVQSIAESMVKLADNSQKIGGIVEIIDEISDRTHLLSLNAALEAAGAGESGSRFSIVAREVRRLAERTDEATAQIKGLVEEIQKATKSTISTTETGSKGMDAAVTLVEGVRQSFADIIGMVDETARSAKEIALSTQQQTSACEQMAETMSELRDVARQVADGAQESDRSMAEVMDLTVRLTELIESELQIKGKQQAETGARLMENVLSGLLAKQRFKVDDLFTDKYEPIYGTYPQKYQTAYDKVLDQEIQGILDEFLVQDDKVVYAILADRNGYVPTHNAIFSQPLTGDRDKDILWNRTKRIFNDPVGLAAVRHDKDVLVQMYFRDTGEKVWDISAPVYVDGRHWGAFRISYTLDQASASLPA